MRICRYVFILAGAFFAASCGDNGGSGLGNQPLSCSDGAQNGDETDIDCGGPCDPCTDGGGCIIASDCASDFCDQLICDSPPSCTDTIQNGDETDEDCGGTICDGCDIGGGCIEDSDCESDNCAAVAAGSGGLAGICAGGTCGDGTIDDNESCDDSGESASCDVDCTDADCGDGMFNMTAGEACDDGSETATCDDDCSAVSCGDSNINETSGETCDDGTETASCDSNCTAVACGDGALNVTAGEECDDGDDTDTNDGCNACQFTDVVYNIPVGQLVNQGIGCPGNPSPSAAVHMVNNVIHLVGPGCRDPWGFDWTDTNSAYSPGTVTVELSVGNVNIPNNNALAHDTTLNGNASGTVGPIQENLTCVPTPQTYTIVLSNPADYVSNGLNSFRVIHPGSSNYGCEGLSPNAGFGGNYARVTISP